jgi:hypothetical protein
LKTAVEKGFLPNIPGLTKAALQKYLPHTVATAKGHLDQSRKNKHSAKTTKLSPFLQIAAAPGDGALTDAFPTAEPPGLATQAIYVDLWDAARGKIFSDLMGRLPVPSSRGNKYIFLLYDYDSNSINVQAIPSHNAHHNLAAYQDIFNMLVLRGQRPLLHHMDNECSKLLVNFMEKEALNATKHHPECTKQMQQNEPSEPSKTTSLQQCAQRTKPSH